MLTNRVVFQAVLDSISHWEEIHDICSKIKQIITNTDPCTVMIAINGDDTLHQKTFFFRETGCALCKVFKYRDRKGKLMPGTLCEKCWMGCNKFGSKWSHFRDAVCTANKEKMQSSALEVLEQLRCIKDAMDGLDPDATYTRERVFMCAGREA